MEYMKIGAPGQFGESNREGTAPDSARDAVRIVKRKSRQKTVELFGVSAFKLLAIIPIAIPSGLAIVGRVYGQGLPIADKDLPDPSAWLGAMWKFVAHSKRTHTLNVFTGELEEIKAAAQPDSGHGAPQGGQK